MKYPEQSIVSDDGDCTMDTKIKTDIAGKNRLDILAVEERMKGQPNAMVGDCFPLKHTFVDGAYVREITMPKGTLLTSKIHKICHPYFVLKGDVSVLTEKGVQRIKAPYSGITQPGTKRILYIHEDTVWTTVHVTGKTDLEEIEKEIIAESYDDIPDWDGLQIKEVEMVDFIKKIEMEKEIVI